MNVCVLGHEGMLGKEVCELLRSRNIKAYARRYMRDSFHLDFGTTHLINCAAYTDVDRSECEITNYELNSYLPFDVARICKDKNVRMIHVSTDYVFTPKYANLKEWDEKKPVNSYGRAKLLGEELVLGVSHKNIVIRLQNLCSVKKGIVQSFYHMQKRGFTPTLDGSVYIKPTSVYMACNAVVSLLEKKANGGIFHFAANHKWSLAELWMWMCVGRGEFKVGSSERLASRPAHSALEASEFFRKRLHKNYFNHVLHVQNLIERIKDEESKLKPISQF